MDKQIPIAFLDFDGVLNNQLYFVKIRNKENADVCSQIDPENVARLNDLIKATGAKVVVTSTWRLGRTVQELQEILEKAGFKGEIIGKTKDLRRGEAGDSIYRGNEIIHWIKENEKLIGGFHYYKYTRYVILDDDSDFLYWQRNNIVICDPYVGMTPKTVFMAKKILDISNGSDLLGS